MNIALFGGTFDPVHRGHVVVARAAVASFGLKQVWFVPADIPPHRQQTPIISFYHRYAMVSLALAGEKAFVPSLLEAPDPDGSGKERRPNYSIETVRRVKKSLGRSDHLYFLIGMDAFRDIAKWYKAEELLAECEFIVAARPGFSLADVGSSLPEKLRPPASVSKLFRGQKIAGPLVLPRATLHMLPETHENISATQIRAAAQRGGALKRLVPDAVADYIQKEGLYRKSATGRRSTPGN
ncbi:MAG TPA: nicotinate (nicotinamide) nucleotide adenylyltransferase [Candidatus Binatia bacterium]|nr:nicotinate (nicotinamide) nucleotide adenylyltransferase [Candidatus Binatia bacterium]